jgi:hypothetical protein
MPVRKRRRNDKCLDDQPKRRLEDDLEGRVDQAVAAITAHCIMTEALVHTICFELADMSRTRLLKVLDIVHNQLEAGLGRDNEVVEAFGEQRDSMRSLLVSIAVHAEMQVPLDGCNR